MVGDPSGRDEARKKRLTAERSNANAKDYFEQVGKVIDLSRAEVHRNGDWFGADVVRRDPAACAAQVTVAQLLTRDDFAKRYRSRDADLPARVPVPDDAGVRLGRHRSDIELGGTEQLYSFMLARDLQKDAGGLRTGRGVAILRRYRRWNSRRGRCGSRSA